MKRDDALRKLAACLRLADRAGTPGEAAAAAAKAQESMDRYSIQQEELAVSGGDFEPEAEEDAVDFGKRDEGQLGAARKRMPLWMQLLASSLSKINGCFLYYSWRGVRRSFELVGKPSNVETVRYLYSYLVREIDRLAEEHGAGMGYVWRREFREGAVSEVVKRLKAQREETARQYAEEHGNSSSALMIVSKALARSENELAVAKRLAYQTHSFGKAKSYGGSRQGDWSARAAGAAAGRSINLGGGRGLGGGRKRIGGGR